MRPLAAQCRWEHHFHWNDCHLVRELAIITSSASQKVVSKVLAILREVFSVMNGASVYQNAPKPKETYNEQDVRGRPA